MSEDVDSGSESLSVVRFRVKEGYVYNIPPVSSIGHRAELWDVENWLKAVSVQVVSVGDSCFVRLFDKETEELFAESPLPSDESKFHTAIESVIDSSRYFVLKIVDRSSGRHAFIGLGFRDRAQASDFNAAIDDHRSFLRRQKEAQRITSERVEAGKDGHEGATQRDLSLKGTIHIDASKLGIGNGHKMVSSHSRESQSSSERRDPTQCLQPLPPPPTAHTSTSAISMKGQNVGGEDAEISEDEWGEFQ